MRVLLTILISVAVPAWIHGQSPSPPTPAFEVASIKPNVSGDMRTNTSIEGERFTAINATVRQLIRAAYEMRDLQIADAPEWVNSSRFDILAKAAAPLKMGGVPLELRQLLADRFRLKVHNESRELPIYALVVARPDGKIGPALRALHVDRCPEAMARAEASARSGQPPGPPVPSQRIECGLRSRPGTLTGGSITIESLAQRLSEITGRVVLDRTGLTGWFDLDVTWAPDQSPDAGPSIFTALQEQLGLKLESTRGPVDVLVIDHVEQPTPD